MAKTLYIKDVRLVVGCPRVPREAMEFMTKEECDGCEWMTGGTHSGGRKVQVSCSHPDNRR